MNKVQEFTLSEDSFLYMSILAKRCGIDLSGYRLEAIYNRLVKRLKELHIEDFDAYCQLLRIDIEEELKFINLITNPTTYFFREPHHFEYVKNYLLKELLLKDKPIRIWSAGCSTGEEPYSISIIVNEIITALNTCNIKILATDINSDSLIIAENGTYDELHMKNITLQRKLMWFDVVNLEDEEEKLYKVKPKISSLISFKKLNFMESWPVHGPFDIIFCRNVLIYFKEEIRQRILENFTSLLASDGLLVLGYSENLQTVRDQYTTVDKTTFKKNHKI